MTDKEIMKAAIDIAVKNGYKDPVPWKHIGDTVSDLHKYWLFVNHDFAKAFWGEDETESTLWKIYQPLEEGELVVYVGTYVLKWKEEEEPTVGFSQAELPAWQHHLQQMVLEKDPIQYLKKFL